jgi:hypothetical protein
VLAVLVLAFCQSDEIKERFEFHLLVVECNVRRPVDGGSKHLRNVGELRQYSTQHLNIHTFMLVAMRTLYLRENIIREQ